MKIQRQNGTLSVGDIRELGADGARLLRNGIRAAISEPLERIEIDLSQVGFMDGRGLGALVSLYKTAVGQNRKAAIRLLHPQPPVQQLLELTRMHRLFEIVPQNNRPPAHQIPQPADSR